MRNALSLTLLLALVSPAGNSSYDWSKPKSCSAQPSPSLGGKLKIKPEDLKGRLLISRRAIFTVELGNQLLIKTEQNFSGLHGVNTEANIACASSEAQKLNYSILAPTVLDLRTQREEAPVIWQFSTLGTEQGVQAHNSVSRILSGTLTAENLFKELGDKLSLYKVSNYQVAMQIQEQERQSNKTMTILFDVVN